MVLSGEEASFYTLHNTQTKLIDCVTVYRQKGHKKGGQSAQRFNRIHDNQVHEYVKKICERANAAFLDKDGTRLVIDGLIVAGMGDIKTQVLSSASTLHAALRAAIRKVITVARTDLSVILPQCQTMLLNGNDQAETELLERTLPSAFRGSGTIYGLDLLHKYIKRAMLQKLIVHDEHKIEEQWIELAKRHGVEVLRVRLQTELGRHFVTDYGGVMGVPWYEMAEDEEEL
jgi:peptide chain release factor subunit 1